MWGDLIFRRAAKWEKLPTYWRKLYVVDSLITAFLETTDLPFCGVSSAIHLVADKGYRTDVAFQRSVLLQIAVVEG